MAEKNLSRALRIGIAGPVGSGKTALVDCLSKQLWPRYNLAVVTNDIYTREDAEFLLRQGTLPQERVRGVETGGCPHAAIREDASMNLEAIADLEETLPGVELIFVESGGDNLAAAFSPELVDAFIYVIDVSGGDKVPRKGGPGIRRSDLLVINKIDLAPMVGASLAVMDRDARMQRSKRPFVFTNLKTNEGLDAIIAWIEQLMKAPEDQRHEVIDAHVPYVGQPHSHGGVMHSHSFSSPAKKQAGELATQAKALYFDCISGISGNMVIGALLDAGLSQDDLLRELAKLNLSGWEMVVTQEMRNYIAGTHVHIKHEKQEHHRRLNDIRTIIESSTLADEIKEKSLKVFTVLAEAESKVHGISKEEVHFHEVGALDAIVDIVGAVAGLHLLGIEQIFASPLPMGSGWIRAEHGALPVPAPAVLYILESVKAPLTADEIATELVTPTGAAILAALATFKRPDLALHRVGYGLGTKQLERPNVMRVWVGQVEVAVKQNNGQSGLLPPRYQGEQEVSAAPMGAAPLLYDAEGRVSWDQMWTDFCDLALAGGPPHRGDLLEPVSVREVEAEPEKYQQVVGEIERGFRLVTGLEVQAYGSPGWVGLVCTDEEMALWMLRAIVVENVSVRREGTVLYLPAGPRFRLEEEIKNVITVVAKTYHYWSEHRGALG